MARWPLRAWSSRMMQSRGFAIFCALFAALLVVGVATPPTGHGQHLVSLVQAGGLARASRVSSAHLRSTFHPSGTLSAEVECEPTDDAEDDGFVLELPPVAPYASALASSAGDLQGGSPGLLAPEESAAWSRFSIGTRPCRGPPARA